MMIDSPLRWIGGKKRLREHIISLLPPHRRFLEPFAGAAWVSLGKPPSEEEVLSDKEPELINFFQVLKAHPMAFIDSFAWELCSRAEFQRLLSLDITQLTTVQRAHRFYYLLMAGWSGEWQYPRFQTSIHDGGHGNRLIGAMRSLPERVWPVHRRLQSIMVEERDWQDALVSYDGPDVLAYLDPPYPGNQVNYSQNMRGWALHRAMAHQLEQVQCKWILSSYDHPTVRKIFHSSTIIPVRFYSGLKPSKDAATRQINEEVLICNFDPSEFLDLQKGRFSPSDLLSPL